MCGKGQDAFIFFHMVVHMASYSSLLHMVVKALFESSLSALNNLDHCVAIEYLCMNLFLHSSLE